MDDETAVLLLIYAFFWAVQIQDSNALSGLVAASQIDQIVPTCGCKSLVACGRWIGYRLADLTANLPKAKGESRAARVGQIQAQSRGRFNYRNQNWLAAQSQGLAVAFARLSQVCLGGETWLSRVGDAAANQ
ncbi:unnamed protein product [Clonostachys chloroleuca]|uniref:Uncharacterized protein n=1 Tax=Clonostachys chloroleuca TaxID=1926264 RepID=A0AA35LY03_9HYPO|nr:unnamed protein product [Clonostachys chloroleuca]